MKKLFLIIFLSIAVAVPVLAFDVWDIIFFHSKKDIIVFDPGDALLLENGDYLLLENGDKLLLE